MLDQQQILQAAAHLDRAERSREQVRQFSLDYPAITIDDAYAIQRAWVAQKIKDGRKLVGHKIGLTSRAMQVSSNISEPDYGALLDDMFFDTISDNAANAGVVMGGRAVRPTEIDLRKVPAVLYRNGVIEESGVSAAVLNHPAKGVAWLANKLAPYDVTLQPGQIILGGSFTRPVAANPGDTFHVDYDMLGSISCRFV